MKKIIILFLSLGCLSVKAQTLSEFNRLGKEAVLKNDNKTAAYYYEKSISLDSLDKTARKGYIVTHDDPKSYRFLSESMTGTTADSTYHTLRAECAVSLQWYDKAVDDYKWLIVNKINVIRNTYQLALAQDQWGRLLYHGHYKYNTKYAEKDKIAVAVFNEAIANYERYITFNQRDVPEVIAEIGNVKVILSDYK